MLYRGAMQFIRNPPMHKLADYPLETARVFIRLIDSLLLLLPKSPSTQATITHRGRKKWSEKDFFGHLQQNVESNKVELVRELYDWSTKTADNVAFGVGQRDGSFSFQYNGKKKAITIFSIYSNGKLTVAFGALNSTMAKSDIEQFRERLAKIPSLNRLARKASPYPGDYIPGLLNTNSEVQDFKDAVGSLKERIRN